jgi:hypothetical protein
MYKNWDKRTVLRHENFDSLLFVRNPSSIIQASATSCLAAFGLPIGGRAEEESLQGTRNWKVLCRRILTEAPEKWLFHTSMQFAVLSSCIMAENGYLGIRSLSVIPTIALPVMLPVPVGCHQGWRLCPLRASSWTKISARHPEP